jgi:hypothetical protein
MLIQSFCSHFRDCHRTQNVIPWKLVLATWKLSQVQGNHINPSDKVFPSKKISI